MSERQDATLLTLLPKVYAYLLHLFPAEFVADFGEEMAALTPRDLLTVPQPVTLRGETWCYQGGEDSYPLAAATDQSAASVEWLTPLELDESGLSVTKISVDRCLPASPEGSRRGRRPSPTSMVHFLPVGKGRKRP